MHDDDVTDATFMAQALAQARAAALLGEIPVGAVIVHGGQVISRGHNRRQVDHDPTAHAELLAIRQAAEALGDWRLEGCTVYVTLEPCAMCAGAMVLARVQRCVFACSDPKGGFLGTLGDLSCHPRLNHRFEVKGGVMADDASELLRGFFFELRTGRRGGG